MGWRDVEARGRDLRATRQEGTEGDRPRRSVLAGRVAGGRRGGRVLI